MSNKVILIGGIASIFFSLIVFLMTQNLLHTIIVFIFSILYFYVILLRRFKQFELKIKRFNECYYFINDYIVALSIKKSIVGAFETVECSASKDLQEELDSIRKLKEDEKLEYLSRYYHFHIYSLFYDVIKLWIEQGGDIIDMSSCVSDQLRENLDYINYCLNLSIRKIIELSVLWVFTFVIVIVLKFSLNSSLKIIIENNIFQLSIIALILIVILSIELVSRKMTSLEIGGWENGQKI